MTVIKSLCSIFSVSIVAMVLCFNNLVYAEGIPKTNEIVKKAESLIIAGDFATAYNLLKPLESQLAGDLNFDMLLGTSALESEHYSQGIFALERVLAVDPDNKIAREKIAKAHFQVGEVETSKAEFKNVLSQNPSEETARAIEKYLSAIDKAMGISTTFSGYLEAGAGWDSNVNSATSANTIAVPDFGGGILNIPTPANAKNKSDTFLNLAGGASFKVPATPSVSYIGSLQFAKKLNKEYQTFETGSVDLNVGIQFKDQNDLYTLAAQDGHFFVDNSNFRHAYGVTAQWQRDISPLNQASVFGQFSKLEYQDNDVRDANRYVLGANYAHVFQTPYNPVIFFGGYLGQEDANKNNTEFLDQDIYGLRAGGQLKVTPSWLAYASAGLEQRDYQDKDPTALIKRKDDQYDLTLGVNYMPARYWTIKPQISLIRNDSNINLYQFERNTMSVNVRREFDW